MEKFRSDENFLKHGLKVPKESLNKKRRSFPSNKVGDGESKCEKEVKKNIQVFSYAPKEDNESETFSEGNSSRNSDQCEAKTMCSDIGSVDETTSTIPESIDIAIVLSKPEPNKKRLLFDDFNEIFLQRKKKIEEQRQRLIEETIEKHPSLLQRNLKVYTKSQFYFMNKKTS